MAARVLGKREAKLYWTDASSIQEITDVEEHLIRSAHTRLLNASWIESMKKHGYQGAGCFRPGEQSL